jgi:sn-glycerol 3-phosphate transport system substrate-binding protein
MNRRKVFFNRSWVTSFLFLSSIALAASGANLAEKSRPIRFLMPPAPFSIEGDKALISLIGEYNKAHPDSPVEILNQGRNFSSLKELIAFYLAGDAPEIAAIEETELQALRALKIHKAIRIKNLGTETLELLPFRRTVPVLVADQEMLFRGRANPNQLPVKWEELSRLIQTLATNLKEVQSHSLVLPLQGPMGLWIFEEIFQANVNRPLWNQGKLDPELPRIISELQSLLDTPHWAKGEENWDRAIQAFLDRKCPLLIASLDLLPYLAKQATFRWSAVPLPTRRGPTQAQPTSSFNPAGSSLVVTRNSPEIQAFLEFLYSPTQAIQWTTQGGFLPLDSRWLKTPQWKSATQGMENYQKLTSQLLQRKAKTLEARPSSPEIVRLRSEWVQALRILFGEPSRRLPTSQVLQQIEKQLAASP